MSKRELIEKAKEAMKNAYVPYSGFSVGAAVRCRSGKIYSGTNIENASYGASVCAERTAIFKAISEGEREIKELALVSSSGDITYPCGICRQVMTEHMKEGTLYFENSKGEISEIPVREIMPYMFDEKSLPGNKLEE